MSSLIRPAASVPSVFTARPEAQTRTRDFFTSHIRNPNTRRAYREAVRQFSSFCVENGIRDLAQVQPIHVAAFVETQLKAHSCRFSNWLAYICSNYLAH
jgi:site-specific recombinase XerD